MRQARDPTTNHHDLVIITDEPAQDYYERAPKGFHILGYDGAGTVLEAGPDCVWFKPGDDISFTGSPTRQGCNSEYQLVSEFTCGRKPMNLDWVQAASFGLTFGTAHQSLFDRLEVRPGENAGILIVGPCYLPCRVLKLTYHLAR